MKTKHTPWRVEDLTQIVNSEENIIATMNFESSDTLSETKANANLIAESPEMLKVLKEVRNFISGVPFSHPYLAKIDTILLKLK